MVERKTRINTCLTTNTFQRRTVCLPAGGGWHRVVDAAPAADHFRLAGIAHQMDEHRHANAAHQAQDDDHGDNPLFPIAGSVGWMSILFTHALMFAHTLVQV